METVIKYRSPLPTSPKQNTKTEASDPLSPTSVYTHRTSHQTFSPFPDHIREPLPAFVNQPLPLPPGSKRTSPLRPRRSIGSSVSMRATPRASILGMPNSNGSHGLLGGRGSPSRMSASRAKGVTIGGKSKLPIQAAQGKGEQDTGYGRTHGFPGSIDFSLPPTTPPKSPPLPDVPSRDQRSGVEIGYRGHSEYSQHPSTSGDPDADHIPLPASLPSTKESHGKGDAYEPVDRSASHFAIASTGLAFDSDAETTAKLSSPIDMAASGPAGPAGKRGAKADTGVKWMPRESEAMAAKYRSRQGRDGERASLAPTLPSLYEPKSAAPRWEAGDSMPSTPVKVKLDRMNRI